ncbi:MAG: hypothetical protein MUC42_01135, partial [Bryobacter sp.]|jgi:hypothetical protein|nr:hypothetical protein [Bryobacter sp.]
VLRAGFGMGYDSFFNNIASNAQGSAPNVVATNFASQNTPQNPRGEPNLSQKIPTVPRAVIPADAQTLVPGDLKNPYYTRWSGGFQRELPQNLLLDVSYVGTKGTRLYLNEQLNPTVPADLQVIPTTSTPIPASRLTGRWDALQGSRNTRTNGGGSNYHGLQVQLNRRFAQGLSGTLAYTWSKMIDNGGDVFSITQVNQTQNPAIPAAFTPLGLRYDRAVSVYDRTQRAVIGVNYELPWQKQQQGIAGRILGGWQLSSVLTFESGVPLNVTNGVDADGIDGSGDRPDYNPAGRWGVRAVPSTASPTGYVNPDDGRRPIDPKEAMFIALPAQSGRTPGRVGNLGRNVLRTPGLNNWDLNVTKNIRLDERFKLELRAEFYNFANHPNFGYSSVSPFSPGGGESGTHQGFQSNVSASPGGQFLRWTVADGGGRVVRYQVRLRF